MSAPTFITLTYPHGQRCRINARNIAQYLIHGNGSHVFYVSGGEELFTETPEQIDAMLGVTEAPRQDVDRFYEALTDVIRGCEALLLADRRGEVK